MAIERLFPPIAVKSLRLKREIMNFILPRMKSGSFLPPSIALLDSLSSFFSLGSFFFVSVSDVAVS